MYMVPVAYRECRPPPPHLPETKYSVAVYCSNLKPVPVPMVQSDLSSGYGSNTIINPTGSMQLQSRTKIKCTPPRAHQIWTRNFSWARRTIGLKFVKFWVNCSGTCRFRYTFGKDGFSCFKGQNRQILTNLSGCLIMFLWDFQIESRRLIIFRPIVGTKIPVLHCKTHQKVLKFSGALRAPTF